MTSESRTVSSCDEYATLSLRELFRLSVGSGSHKEPFLSASYRLASLLRANTDVLYSPVYDSILPPFLCIDACFFDYELRIRDLL